MRGQLIKDNFCFSLLWRDNTQISVAKVLEVLDNENRYITPIFWQVMKVLILNKTMIIDYTLL